MWVVVLEVHLETELQDSGTGLKGQTEMALKIHPSTKTKYCLLHMESTNVSR